MEKQQTVNHIRKEQKHLILGLVAAVIALDGIVLLTAGSEFEILVSDLSRVSTVGSAFVLSTLVVARQKVNGLFGKAYAALAAGLVLWLLAEATWAYYEIGLQIETPFPSIADIFWIGAYGGLGYHLFALSRFFGKGVKKSTIAIVVAGVVIFSGFYIQSIISVSELEGPDTFAPLAISVAYPVLDAILMVPAVLIVLNSGRGVLTSIPWIFVAMILVFIADSLLGITAVTNFTGETFHITMVYNASYLCFMAGLVWYNKLFIFNEKKKSFAV